MEPTEISFDLSKIPAAAAAATAAAAAAAEPQQAAAAGRGLDLMETNSRFSK